MELADVVVQINQTQKNIDEFADDIILKLQDRNKKLSKLKHEISKSQEIQFKLQREINFLKDEIKKIEMALSKFSPNSPNSTELQVLQNENEILQQENMDLQLKIKNLKRQLPTSAQPSNIKIQEISSLQTQNENQKKTITNLQNQNSQLKEENDHYELGILNFQQSNKSYEEEIQDFEEIHGFSSPKTINHFNQTTNESSHPFIEKSRPTLFFEPTSKATRSDYRPIDFQEIPNRPNSPFNEDKTPDIFQNLSIPSELESDSSLEIIPQSDSNPDFNSFDDQ